MVPVASEISIPFRLGQDSHILAETIPDAQIRQHVMSLVNTEPGERVVLGGYGVPLSEMLFEDDDEETASDVAVDIANAMATYEPGVQIQELQPIPGLPETGCRWSPSSTCELTPPRPGSSTARSRTSP
jgi:phage baseplate assembly protein W